MSPPVRPRSTPPLASASAPLSAISRRNGLVEASLAVLLSAAVVPAPTPPVAAPISPSRPTWAQSTSPVANFWMPALAPPAINPPDAAISAMPAGPPTPVNISATPPTIIAPAARYSQFSPAQSADFANPFWPISSR